MRIVVVFILFLLSICRMDALSFDNETLSYRVTYKWGIIQKVAGDASMTLRKLPDGYKSVLTARTRPWADPIFSVRDTLIGHMLPETMWPTLYDKNTHEGGSYRHDLLRYTYRGDMATANVQRWKSKKGVVAYSDTIMSARLPAVDMLSVYFWVRRLPFENMVTGQLTRANIFSGAKIETLTIKYAGKKIIKLDDCKWECYEIHFNFSSERMNNSSAPMKAWIRTDGMRIPVKLEGELPIGKIQVLWNNPEVKK